MSYITRTLWSGFACDSGHCDSKLRFPESATGFAPTGARAAAIAAGWTFWASTQWGQRMYCPQHGPSRGSRMRQVHE